MLSCCGIVGKSSQCGGSRFHLPLFKWSFTICLTPNNHKNVLSVLFNKLIRPSFIGCKGAVLQLPRTSYTLSFLRRYPHFCSLPILHQITAFFFDHTDSSRIASVSVLIVQHSDTSSQVLTLASHNSKTQRRHSRFPLPQHRPSPSLYVQYANSEHSMGVIWWGTSGTCPPPPPICLWGGRQNI